MRAMYLFTKIVYRGLLLGLMAVLLTACNVANTTTKATAKSIPTTAVHTTLKTSDGKILIQFDITPNRLGTNMFVVGVKDARSGKPETNEQAQIFATMLDMDMGTGVILLQPDGKGQYSAPASLSMDGNWDFHIQLLDATDTAVHIARLKVHVAA